MFVKGSGVLVNQVMIEAPRRAWMGGVRILPSQGAEIPVHPVGCGNGGHGGPLLQNPAISIVICSIDAEKFKAVSQTYADALAGESYETIAIHDAKSLAEGYNRGIAQSRGSIVVFSHDDIEILTPDFARRLRNYLNVYDVVGVAGTTCLIDAKWLAAGHPHLHGNVTHPAGQSGEFEITLYGARATAVKHIQALDGLFFAVRRKVLDAVRFDAETFDGFHCYDVDFTFSAYQKGFKLAVCNDLTLIHRSDGKFDESWALYRERFLAKHGAKLGKKPARDAVLASLRVKTRQEVLVYCTPETLCEASRRLV